MEVENYRKYFVRITRSAERYYNLHMTDGLTAQEAHALRVISFHKEISQQVLADRLGVDKSSVTRLVNKLEAAGYLTRTVNPEDRREKLISSTPKADAVKARDLELTNQYYNWLFSHLEPEERAQFTAILQKLYDRATESRKNNFAEVEGFECT